MDAVLSVRKYDSVLVKVGWRLSWRILYWSPVCQTLSKALVTSRSTMSVVSLCTVFMASVSFNVAIAVCVPLCFLKPCCLVLCMLWMVRCSYSLLLSILSESFPYMSSNEIGLWFLTWCCEVLGLGRNIMMACFSESGK